MDLLLESLRQSWLLLLQSGPYLLMGFVLAGLLHILLPVERLSRWLGRPTSGSVLRAALIGVPLPLCSCSVVPVAASLRRAGASRGATSAFLISTPESGVDSIAATWALLDPVMTVARPVAAFFTAFTAGLLQNVWDRRVSTPDLQTHASSQPAAARGVVRPAAVAGCCSHSVPAAVPVAGPAAACCSPSATPLTIAEGPAVPGRADGPDVFLGRPPDASAAAGIGRLGAKLMRGLRYGLVEMFEDLGRYMILGFLLAGVLTVLLDRYLPLRSALGSPWAPLVMLVAGTPVYVCAASATPMIAVLISQGLSPGAGLVFLLAGPATNAASVVLLRQLIGGAGVGLYLLSIVACALTAGYLVDATYDLLGLAPRALVRAAACHQSPTWVDAGAALVLAACMLHGTVRRYAKGLRARRRADGPQSALR